jgi:hypothetical protein
MKFKDLSENDIEYAKSVYINKELTWDDRMLTLMKFFGRSERTVRKYINFEF